MWMYFIFSFCLFSEKYLTICGYLTCITALLVIASHIVWSVVRNIHSPSVLEITLKAKGSQCYFVWKIVETKPYFTDAKLLLYKFCCCTYQNRSFCDFSVLLRHSLLSACCHKFCQKYLEYVPLWARWTVCNLYFNCQVLCFYFLLTGKKSL